MRAVSNTSPLCYLILIKEIRILPELFDEVVIPLAVGRELAHPDAPREARSWIQDPPQWLSVLDAPAAAPEERELWRLDPGEREAILLAERLSSDLLLLDDRKARELAHSRGLPITGLIGLLRVAAERGLLDLDGAVERLRATNFRVSRRLLEMLLS
jgi:predicted nucleic acid-binding protein